MLHDTVLVLIGKKSHMWKVIFLRAYSAQYLYSYTITTMYPFWKWHQNSALMALVQLQFGFQANRKSRLDIICKNTKKIIHLPNHSFDITYYDPYFIMVTKISRTCNGMPKGQLYPQLVQERGNSTNHFNGASPNTNIETIIIYHSKSHEDSFNPRYPNNPNLDPPPVDLIWTLFNNQHNGTLLAFISD